LTFPEATSPFMQAPGFARGLSFLSRSNQRIPEFTRKAKPLASAQQTDFIFDPGFAAVKMFVEKKRFIPSFLTGKELGAAFVLRQEL